jgi:hypothetical protein
MNVQKPSLSVALNSIRHRLSSFQFGPNKTYLCDRPTTGIVATLETPGSSPWPECVQLACKCLGKDGGLTIAQSKKAWDSALASKGNYDMYEDALGVGYVIPKRVNYGTFKYNDPTWDSRCTCDEDGALPRKFLYLQIKKMECVELSVF